MNEIITAAKTVASISESTIVLSILACIGIILIIFLGLVFKWLKPQLEKLVTFHITQVSGIANNIQNISTVVDSIKEQQKSINKLIQTNELLVMSVKKTISIIQEMSRLSNVLLLIEDEKNDIIWFKNYFLEWANKRKLNIIPTNDISEAISQLSSSRIIVLDWFVEPVRSTESVKLFLLAAHQLNKLVIIHTSSELPENEFVGAYRVVRKSSNPEMLKEALNSAYEISGNLHQDN